MMSITKQSKWGGSEAVPPKAPEETLSSGEDDSTESLNSYEYSENSEPISGNCSFYDCSAFVTQSEPLLCNTSLLSGRESVINVRQSLELYKFKAASTIQNFFKAKKAQQKILNFTINLSKLSESTAKKHKIYSIKLIKSWIFTKKRAAKIIQLNWKVYKARISQNLPSPRRQMLARAVSIGGSILKIHAMIEKVVSRRSSPSSPTKETKRFHRKLSPQMKSQSFSINLVQSAFEDENETQDSKPSTPAPEFYNKHNRNQSIDSTWESVNESTVIGSLVMKRDIRIRTKRRITMNLEELNFALKSDLEVDRWNCAVENSCIPALKRDSKFYSFKDFNYLKNELICEYKNLIKY